MAKKIFLLYGGIVMQEVLITPEGIQKNLKKYKPLDALCEYVWNGFDAQATTVKIELNYNELGMLNSLSVIDDGTGIRYEELKQKFKPFNESQKFDNLNRNNHTLPHGKQGIGRLTFFAFAQEAIWRTVYEKDGKNYSYYIKINRDSLNQFDDNGGDLPKRVDDNSGTIVTFTGISSFSKKEIIDKLRETFFWFLKLNQYNSYRIIVDDICHNDAVLPAPLIS